MALSEYPKWLHADGKTSVLVTDADSELKQMMEWGTLDAAASVSDDIHSAPSGSHPSIGSILAPNPLTGDGVADEAGSSDDDASDTDDTTSDDDDDGDLDPDEDKIPDDAESVDDEQAEDDVSDEQEPTPADVEDLEPEQPQKPRRGRPRRS